MEINTVIERDAETLVENRLIGFIEDGSPDGHKSAFRLVKEDLEDYDELKEKIAFLKFVNISLDKHKQNHQLECKAASRGEDCYWEKQYDTVMALVKNKIQTLSASIKPMTFIEKIRLIFTELSQRPDRRGDLEAILKLLEVPYISSDLSEFIDYFKSSGFVDTRFITKDGIDIILRQSGLDYLYSSEKNTDKLKINIQERKEYEKRIFLAHASEDKVAVRKLYRKLKENGLEPWLDEENLHPGVRWDDEIKKAIKNSRIFLACISNNSIAKSGYVQKELRMALAELENKPPGYIYFIPALIEDVELPNISVGTLNLQEYQAAKVYDEEGFERLIAQLKKQLNVIERVEKKEKVEFKDVRNLIMHGRLEDALSELTEQMSKAKNSDYNSLILLSSRFHSLNRQYNIGVIDFGEYSRTLNQINYAILELIRQREE